MEQSLASTQSTINVCSQIKCPFAKHQSQTSVSGGCARYCDSSHCHLASVFAFVSDGHWLFTVNETELRHMKNINDRWIAKETLNAQKGGEEKAVIPAKNQSYFLKSSYRSFAISPQKATWMSIGVLNSIQFEAY